MSRIFQNPIIPGFAPDPSIILIEDTFFLVNSSFHIFPGLPIYASKNLSQWTHIGNAINRPTQIDLSEATTDSFPIGPNEHLFAALGLFAPTIRWHKGTFYIACTNLRRDEAGKLKTNNFYITCENIWTNKWSNPIWFEFNGIDPSIFFDDDDRAYIQGSWREGTIANQTCTIRQFEIEVASGKPLSDVRVVWDHGGKKSDIEGPHMYKKDGYYYLLVADGGTFEHHRASIARSKNIWGPFEIYEGNPILTADNTDEYIQHVGHADLFQDQFGIWWAVALGVRKDNGAFPMGRESFLLPVEWPEGGWPICGCAKMEFHRDTRLPGEPLILSSIQDVRIDHAYVRNADLRDYSYSTDGRMISIVPRTNDMSTSKHSTSFVGRRQRSQVCIVEVGLRIPQRRGVTAGLTVYKDDCRHVDLSYNSDTGTVALISCFKMKGSLQVLKEWSIKMPLLKMKINTTIQHYEFSIRDGQDSNWVALGKIAASEMSGIDFTGVIFGIWTCTKNGDETNPVHFEDFRVS